MASPPVTTYDIKTTSREAPKISKPKTTTGTSTSTSTGTTQPNATGATSTTSTTPQTATGTQTGMFNFQQLMKDFYNYKPKADDVAGQMQKQAFQGNFLQSMIDSQLAMQLGQFNSGLSQQNMTHQADLEQRNQSALMADQFKYAMQSMGSQFELQNTAADSQHERDLGMLAATGQQQRDNIRETGNQDRISAVVKGEQDRETAHLNNQSAERMQQGKNETNISLGELDYKGKTDVAKTQADASKYDSDARTNQAQIGADASRDVASTEADAKKFSATAAADASMYGADRTVDVAKVNAQGTIDNTKETGNQTRLTMGEETRQKAKDRANMHSYARSTARAM